MELVQKGPAYRIHTRRLVLRCWNPEDVKLQMAAIAASLDHLLPWMPWAKQEPAGVETRVEWLRKARAKFDLAR